MSIPREGSREIGQGRVVSIAPDVCLTPIGSSMVPVPYSLVAYQNIDPANMANSVRQTSLVSHVKSSLITKSFGDEPGTGGGVKSGTTGAECEPKTYSSTVRAEGRNMVRFDDEWWMNHKNTVGKLIYTDDLNRYSGPPPSNTEYVLLAQNTATGVMSDAPSIPFPKTIPAPPRGLLLGLTAEMMQQLDKYRADQAVQSAAQQFGLDLGNPADVLGARAYTWGKNMAPMAYWNVPYSGAANEAVARSIMNLELQHPGTLGRAVAGNRGDKEKIDAAVAAGLAAAAAGTMVRVTGKERERQRQILCHYTTAKGMVAILATQQILPSLKAVNPSDARYGDGQYFSDIPPGTMTSSELAKIFINRPFPAAKFSNYVCVDVSGLEVTKGRDHVYVVPNQVPLNIAGRVFAAGRNDP
ncbi:PAAR-like domain-containing protein [Rhizobium leguminosarum]